jgi:protein-S-isoprenylcysteine O-methyltransferase Ste14
VARPRLVGTLYAARRSGSRIPLVLWLRALFFVLLLPGTIGYALPIWLGSSSGRPLGWLGWLGLLPLATGTAVLLWCVRDFAVRGRGTLAPVDPPRTLVAVGLYRWVRNPMYVGVVTTLLGHALWFGSPSLLLYAALVATGFQLFVVLYEEPALERRFGESYQRYRAAVPRWIPRRPASRSSR